MKIDIKKLICRIKITRFIFASLLITVIILNYSPMMEAHDKIRKYKKLVPTQNVGYKFDKLRSFIPQDTKYVGYFTGKELTGKKDVKYFSQAQYLLAPAILEHDNLEHEYTLFVCDERITLEIIKRLNLEPLRRNSFGMILTRKRK